MAWRGLVWKQSAVRAIHTCAYRLNIAWGESSWNVKWRGELRKNGKRRKKRGEENEAKQRSRQCRGVGREGEEGKKQIWSGKLVHLNSQKTRSNSQNKTKGAPGNKTLNSWKEQWWKQEKVCSDWHICALFSLWIGEVKLTKSKHCPVRAKAAKKAENIWEVRSLCTASDSCWVLSLAGREAVWAFQIHCWMTSFPVYAEQHLTNGKASIWVDYTWTSCCWMSLVWFKSSNIPSNRIHILPLLSD